MDNSSFDPSHVVKYGDLGKHEKPTQFLYDQETTLQKLTNKKRIALLEYNYSAAELLECARDIKRGALDGIDTPKKEACFYIAMNILLFSTWGSSLPLPYKEIVDHLIKLFGEQTFVHCFNILSIIHAEGFRDRDVTSNTTIPYVDFRIYENEYLSIANELLDIDYKDLLQRDKKVSSLLYKDLHFGSNNVPKKNWAVSKGGNGNLKPIWGEPELLKEIMKSHPDAYRKISEFILPMLDTSSVIAHLEKGFHPLYPRTYVPMTSVFEKGKFLFNQEAMMNEGEERNIYKPHEWQKLALAFKFLAFDTNPQLTHQCNRIQSIFANCHS